MRLAIDVRTAEDSAFLEEIVAAVQRLEVGSQESKLTSLTAVEAREATWQPRNPYKGLRAFRREDAADFFGRDRLIAELVETAEEPAHRAATGEHSGATARFDRGEWVG